MSTHRSQRKLGIFPLTPDRWPDFEKLFGERGACGGCWCMFWRLTRREFEAGKGSPNRKAMKALVESGKVPGLLAYDGDEPVGWCAVAPRDQYPGLQRSRLLKPIDTEPVWSVSCLFVAKEYRRQGISLELSKAAVDYVRKSGGRIVEGYPKDPAKEQMPDVFAWTGLFSAFRKAKYREVARPAPTRPIMRFEISGAGRHVPE